MKISSYWQTAERERGPNHFFFIYVYKNEKELTVPHICALGNLGSPLSNYLEIHDRSDRLHQHGLWIEHCTKQGRRGMFLFCLNLFLFSFSQVCYGDGKNKKMKDAAWKLYLHLLFSLFSWSISVTHNLSLFVLIHYSLHSFSQVFRGEWRSGFIWEIPKSSLGTQIDRSVIFFVFFVYSDLLLFAFGFFF